MSHSFKPAWWLLRSSHLHTLLPVICKRDIPHLKIERERLELPDGDFIDLDWHMRPRKDLPLVLILHGLEGSINSHYAKSMMQALAQQGWRSVFMHFRGCSGEHNRLLRGYHSGETSDITFVVRELFSREPNLQLAVIGYSLGGNVLLKWLGETGKDNPVIAATAISVPFELHKAAERLQNGFSRFYQWYFINCLRERLTAKFAEQSFSFDLSLLNKVNTMYEFDDKITAPIHGFSSAQEYYRMTSSRQYLRSIQVPTLVLHAKDDPFMTHEAIPKEDELSPQVTLEVTETGGHVGFVEGKLPWKPEYWLEKRVPLFLRDYLGGYAEAGLEEYAVEEVG